LQEFVKIQKILKPLFFTYQKSSEQHFTLKITVILTVLFSKPSKRSRGFASAGMFVNGVYISDFSRTQAAVALGSWESELYAAYLAIAEGLFLVRACMFLCGDQMDENSGEVRVKLHNDSSAVMGTIQREGFGRMKAFMK